MQNFIAFLYTVLANVIADYISKRLDGRKELGNEHQKDLKKSPLRMF